MQNKINYPNSNKIYVKGSIHNIEVGMRQINLHDTVEVAGGERRVTPNMPVVVYDTSGPFSDASINIDLKKGLPRLRESWVSERDDVEQLPSITSNYGKQRIADSSLDPLRFKHIIRFLHVIGNYFYQSFFFFSIF